MFLNKRAKNSLWLPLCLPVPSRTPTCPRYHQTGLLRAIRSQQEAGQEPLSCHVTGTAPKGQGLPLLRNGDDPAVAYRAHPRTWSPPELEPCACSVPQCPPSCTLSKPGADCPCSSPKPGPRMGPGCTSSRGQVHPSTSVESAGPTGCEPQAGPSGNMGFAVTLPSTRPLAAGTERPEHGVVAA